MGRPPTTTHTPVSLPPRKRRRRSPPDGGTPNTNTESILLPTEPWTPEEETALFKALIRYKPTGLHKHFHMLSIATFLRTHGHCAAPLSSGSTRASSPAGSADVPHTRIPGIWRKLGELYDLEALDEREHAHAEETAAEERRNRGAEGADDGTEDGGDGNVVFDKEFSLPVGDVEGYGVLDDAEVESGSEAEGGKSFTTMMWRRRFPSEPATSPPEMGPAGSSRPSTPSVRGAGRGRGRGRGRATAKASGRRRSTKASVEVEETPEVESVKKSDDAGEEEEEEEVEASDGEGEEGTSSSSDDDEVTEEGTVSTPARGGRGAGRGRGRGGRGGRGRRGRRGRGRGG